MANKKLQVIYISHGGGPLPILGDPSHEKMNYFMKTIPSLLRRPDAIVVISAHWEERTLAVQGGENPELYYDYYGFPDEAYSIKYAPPGNPELAGIIKDLFLDYNIDCTIDSQRGYDHGLFIPLKLMFPEAEIPSIQLSLKKGLDPEFHINVGRVLNKLSDENILIIGSGFSFHNMMFFNYTQNPAVDEKNDSFQNWLIDICTGEHSMDKRKQELINWEKVPSARYCHPREEHLLPLHVCCGAAQAQGRLVFDDYIAGKRALAILWN